MRGPLEDEADDQTLRRLVVSSCDPSASYISTMTNGMFDCACHGPGAPVFEPPIVT